jgi:hypothetical protein
MPNLSGSARRAALICVVFSALAFAQNPTVEKSLPGVDLKGLTPSQKLSVGAV